MVRTKRSKAIPARSSPGSTRITAGVGVPGHPSTSGLQDSANPVEQPGLEAEQQLEAGPSAREPGLQAAGLLEQQQPQHRKKFGKIKNKTIMICYYKSSPSRRGYLKRMHQLWKEQHPESELTEQRVADQCRFIIRNKVFTEIELEELQREVQNVKIEALPEITAAITTATTGEKEEELVVEELDVGRSPSTQLKAASPLPFFQQDQHQLTKDQEELKERILEGATSAKSRIRLPALKLVSKKQLNKVLVNINQVLATITTNSLKEINGIMYSTAVIATEKLGCKVSKKQTSSTIPKWKIRLENKISQLRADASKLKAMKEKKLKNNKTKHQLIVKYQLNERKIKEVLEIIKQRITAVASKITRYEGRIAQFRQNLQFSTNQKRFYQQINGETAKEQQVPNKEETVQFWAKLWDNPKEYNKNAAWVKGVEKNKPKNKMQDLTITTEMVAKRAKKIKNWSAPGEDELHGFWLKHLTGLHPSIAKHFNNILQDGELEEWLTTGKTHLIIKDLTKGAVPSNYQPITCLPTTYKLLTGVVADAIQQHLTINKLFPSEQKGNRPNSRGTKDQLLIDKMILENCKKRKTNLNVAWIDYKKAFDSLPHDWIMKCLEIVGVSNNIKQFVQKSMSQWKTQLTVNGDTIGQVNIKRGIFQGDSLSPLLFVTSLFPLTTILNKSGLGYQTSKTSARLNHLLYMDDLKLYGKTTSEIESLLNTVRIFSQDIAMEFGLDKCATLTIKKGKVTESEGIKMPYTNNIKSLEEDEHYKYLGILQAENIKHTEVKKKVSTEYQKRIRKILKSKLNAGNTITAINTWAVPVIRYTAGIINWTKAELDALDRKTRKLMTIHHALHPRSDIDRLYLQRSIGGRGLLQVHQTVEEEKRALAEYIKDSEENALQLVHNQKLLNTNETKLAYKKEQETTRKEEWHNKPLHGQYIKNIADKVDIKRTWQWLRAGKLKKATEGLILAAQDQSLRTNAYKARIEKTSTDSKCRLCKEQDETVDHLISCCKKIAQTDYKERHDKVAKMVHWNICKNYHLNVKKNWWDHEIDKVLENEAVKILWDFKIQTDKHLPHNTPDITIIEKKEKKVWIVDIAIPGDSRIEEKEQEKITKYKDLLIEIERLWKKKAKVVPIVIGALGAIPKHLEHHLSTLNIKEINITQLQKAALLGTAYILRRYL